MAAREMVLLIIFVFKAREAGAEALAFFKLKVLI